MLISLKETASKIKTDILEPFETFQSSQQENKPEITGKQTHQPKAKKCCNYSGHVLLPWPVGSQWFHYMTLVSSFSWFVAQPPQGNMKSNFKRNFYF